MAQDGTLPLSLFVTLPDVVHLGKSMKCSWTNLFIDLEGAKSSLVLIRTLRDSAGPDMRKKLRKLLTLDCVRNKDRKAVEPIMRLTGASILDLHSTERNKFGRAHNSSRKVSLLENQSEWGFQKTHYS